MDYLVTKNPDELNESDIVVDSDFPNDVKCIRIDHHVDDSLTNIDSIYRAFQGGKSFESTPNRIVTSTIDTDSIISAAIVDMLLSGAIQSIDNELINSEIFKTLYSSCFWCDYNVEYNRFSKDFNDKGELLDLYLRQELQIYIGLSYREKIVGREQSNLFEKLVGKVKDIIRRGSLPLHILEFPRDEVYSEITDIAKKCVLEETAGNNIVGYIKTPDNEHLLPRVYFKLFKQPLIARITFKEDNEISLLLGINPYALKEWNKVNLKKLAEKLNKVNDNIKFSGRRNVIKTRFKGNIEEIYKILSQVELDDLYDENNLFTIYENRM
ncbi:MAG: hypothetical protein GWP03_05580 [Proteobacteria bacterium]|nr:hypothetical protein [Pseudomonadota bacterium]